MTVVYVTHDQEEAMNMSDRIAIMNRGRIEHVGPPDQVYEHPSNRFVARFLGEANLLEGRIVHCTRDEALIEAGGHQLRARVDQGAKPAAAAAAALFVRPERVRIGAVADDAPNQLSGTVTRLSFLGNVVRYRVETTSGLALVVDAQNSGATVWREGSQVAVSFRAEDSMALTG